MKFPQIRIKDPRETELEEKISVHENDIGDYLELGYIYLGAGKFDEQVELYDRALKVTSNDLEKGEVHYGKGVALFELGREEEAFKELKSAIKFMDGVSGSAGALEIKGLSELYLAYSEDKEESEKASRDAVKAFSQLIKDFPEFVRLASIYLMLERLYFEAGELEDALKASKKALLLSKDEEEKATALLCIADDLRLLKDYDAAESYYNKALDEASKKKTHLSEIYHGLGHIFEARGETDEAIEAYLNALDKTIRLEPGEDDGEVAAGIPKGVIDYISSIEYRLGGLYEETRDFRLSVYHYSNALDNITKGAPGYAEVKFSLGKSYFQLKKFIKSRDTFKDFLVTGKASDVEIAETTYHLAMIYDHLKEHALMIEAYELLLDISHDYDKDAELFYRLSIAYMHMDKRARAIKELTRIISGNLETDKREIILYLISNLYLSFEQIADCKRHLSMLEEEFPGSSLASEIRNYLKVREKEDNDHDL